MTDAPEVPAQLLPAAAMLAGVWPMLAAMAAPMAAGPGFPWQEGLDEDARRLAADIGGVGHDAFRAAVIGEAASRTLTHVAGMSRLAELGSLPPTPPRPVLWQRGPARLLDHGGEGVPVLIVPSLINSARILDLAPGDSLIEAIRAAGLRPLLLDWGRPGIGEAGLDLAAHVETCILPALARARDLGGGRAGLLGYCLGGTLAAAAAAHPRGRPDALALLAPLWTATADRPDWLAALADVACAMWPEGRPVPPGLLPGEVVAWLMAAFQPTRALDRYRLLAEAAPGDAQARRVARLEVWAGTPVPLAMPAAADVLAGFFGRDMAARGRWRVGSRTVEPSEIGAPTLIALAGRDVIVPPAAAAGLAATIPGAVTFTVETGHVGLVAGRRAATDVHGRVAAHLARYLGSG
ncbi:alpha/beta fold hydrolase [Futiania mangrovi]|uniref:AB hydrolase-1 domain-containing protein n=1 Tax=Futiania mangrovi TaxID=2959716 RepID=A0A9J6PEX1_9PROT|nr:alpha/beta fold hydrolase [Futiania mangrovii]MCP1336339.1 hypothetical protein [Futiania mangrovii]